MGKQCPNQKKRTLRNKRIKNLHNPSPSGIRKQRDKARFSGWCQKPMVVMECLQQESVMQAIRSCF